MGIYTTVLGGAGDASPCSIFNDVLAVDDILLCKAKIYQIHITLIRIKSSSSQAKVTGLNIPMYKALFMYISDSCYHFLGQNATCSDTKVLMMIFKNIMKTASYQIHDEYPEIIWFLSATIF